MITKQFTPKRTVCKVTFSLDAEKVTDSVSVVGDFNDWDPKAGEMKKKGDAYTLTVRVKPETDYKFKYYIDGENWEIDESADELVSNEYGTEDSVIKVGA